MWDLIVSVPDHCLSFYFVAICWERAVPFAFNLCCFFYSSAVLILGVPFPFGVKGRIWNSIVSVPDHSIFIYFTGSSAVAQNIDCRSA